jgi:hypothetical protein
VTERDWKQIEADLDELRACRSEQGHSAPPNPRPTAAPEDETAILKHIAEALRLDLV